MSVPLRHPRFTFVPVASEGVLHDSDSDLVIHLDEHGAMIWALCDGQRTVGEITQLISDAYPDQREAVATDVTRIIDTLAEQQVLTLSP